MTYDEQLRCHERQGESDGCLLVSVACSAVNAILPRYVLYASWKLRIGNGAGVSVDGIRQLTNDD